MTKDPNTTPIARFIQYVFTVLSRFNGLFLSCLLWSDLHHRLCPSRFCLEYFLHLRWGTRLTNAQAARI